MLGELRAEERSTAVGGVAEGGSGRAELREGGGGRPADGEDRRAGDRRQQPFQDVQVREQEAGLRRAVGERAAGARRMPREGVPEEDAGRGAAERAQTTVPEGSSQSAGLALVAAKRPSAAHGRRCAGPPASCRSLVKAMPEKRPPR